MPSEASTATERFGSLVRDARRAHDLSQDELSAISGVSQSAISLYEQGLTEPSFRAAVLLATSLDLDVNLLAALFRPAPALERAS